MDAALARARDLLLAGDATGAAAALDPFDVQARIVATLTLSRAATAHGVGPHAQEPLFRALDARIVPDPKGNPPGGSLDGMIFRSWYEASVAFPIERVALVLGHAPFVGTTLAPDAVRTALAAGKVDDAVRFASLIPKARKAVRAEALARIAVHASEKKRAKEIAKVVKAAAKGKVQDGGEEADALGAILDVLVEAGIPSSDPSFEVIGAELLRLAHPEVRRQVTDGGVLRAIRACVRRDDDPTLRALGEKLEANALLHPFSRREAGAIRAAARGEPPPPPTAAHDEPIKTTAFPSPASIGARAVAKLALGDAAAATAVLEERPSESYLAAREAAQQLLDGGHEALAVSWAAPIFGAFEIVARGVRDPASLDGLEAALFGLLSGQRGFAVSALTRAAVRLGVVEAWRARLLPRIDALGARRENQDHRDRAYSILVATAQPTEALELASRWLEGRDVDGAVP